MRFEGAVGYLLAKKGAVCAVWIGSISAAFHGVRAAAMMRRCLNEALTAARGGLHSANRSCAPAGPPAAEDYAPHPAGAFGVPLHHAVMEKADAGDETAAAMLGLTPLIKFRACRDNIPVATAAMEVRGGNGFIEDWVKHGW